MPSVLGGLLSPHRARLFPLPLLRTAWKPPCHSARNRSRFRRRCALIAVTNHCIYTLNRMYSTTSASLPACTISSLSPFTLSQPDNLSLARCSVGQQRLLSQLTSQCISFVSKARAWCASPSACDIDALAFDVLTSSLCAVAHDHPLDDPSPSRTNRLPNDFSARVMTRPLFQQEYDPLLQTPFLPRSSAFSSSPTCVVPLIAQRVALPDSLHIVPLESVLPVSVAASYTAAAAPALLRSPLAVWELNVARPLCPPRVAGCRTEYVHLIGRLVERGMISFTATPAAVNGVFTVGKDAVSDRLIIDAQPANRLFVDCPPVSLPDPSHLVQLQVPAGSTVYVGKSDLSNFYHHIGLPQWMQPYFALPSLTAAELVSIGIPSAPGDSLYPMCLTLPMGFSHAVYLAQAVHEHIVYAAGSLALEHNLLHMPSPLVTAKSALHGIVIDDFFLFSLNQSLATQQLTRVLAAYRTAGFIVKESKVVMPTAAPVKVIGFDIDGTSSSVSLSIPSRLSLVRSTLQVLQLPSITGTALSHLIGRWTWCLLIRRPALSVLQHSYRFIQIAGSRRFDLWPSVRRELAALLGLLPLLQCRLDAPIFPRIVATDASERGAGVVCTPFTAPDTAMYWPMCSSRRHATLQALLQCESDANPLLSPGICLTPLQRSQLLQTRHWFNTFYTDVSNHRWSTIVSKAWRAPEHINASELRVVLLAIHWILSYPSSLHRRVYLLVDSTVAFFSLWKGRSSSASLLLILRQIAALQLASGLSLCTGWIPSEVNPADGPSRHFPHD